MSDTEIREVTPGTEPTTFDVKQMARTLLQAYVDMTDEQAPDFLREIMAARFAGLFEAWLILVQRHEEGYALIGDRQGTITLTEQVLADALALADREDEVFATTPVA